MKYTNIMIDRWGVNRNNIHLKKQEIKFPKECKVKIEFTNKTVGTANNFKINNAGIYCDLVLNTTKAKTVAPNYICEELIHKDRKDYPIGLELIDIMVVEEHASKKLNNNLLKKRRIQNGK